MNGVQGVEGSNPFIPTRDLKGIHANMDSLFSFVAESPRNTAQFEARLNGIQEAVSSILSSSTRYLKTPDHRKMGGGFWRVHGVRNSIQNHFFPGWLPEVST